VLVAHGRRVSVEILDLATGGRPTPLGEPLEVGL
jgi:hypothetical protein